eukprot:scaffold587348_cov50-Prasinocladus_malaysianus.AAC.1
MGANLHRQLLGAVDTLPKQHVERLSGVADAPQPLDQAAPVVRPAAGRVGAVDIGALAGTVGKGGEVAVANATRRGDFFLVSAFTRRQLYLQHLRNGAAAHWPRGRG